MVGKAENAVLIPGVHVLIAWAPPTGKKIWGGQGFQNLSYVGTAGRLMLCCSPGKFGTNTDALCPGVELVGVVIC